MIKSLYDATHFGGSDKACDVPSAACLYSSNMSQFWLYGKAKYTLAERGVKVVDVAGS